MACTLSCPLIYAGLHRDGYLGQIYQFARHRLPDTAALIRAVHQYESCHRSILSR
jgi:hypothetical protein